MDEAIHKAFMEGDGKSPGIAKQKLVTPKYFLKDRVLRVFLLVISQFWALLKVLLYFIVIF